jgi:hypothetical protein
VLHPINYRRYRPSVDLSHSVFSRFERWNVSSVWNECLSEQQRHLT